MNAAGAVLDDDQGIEAPQQHGVHMDKVDRQHAAGLRGQELLPGRTRAAREYTAAIAAGDDDVTAAAAYNLGNVLANEGNRAAAVDAWYTAVNAAPSAVTPSAAFNLANAYAGEADTGLATALYEMAAQLGSPECARRHS